MSTHKHFDKICCVVLILTLILSVLFINAENFGIKKASTVMGYEKTLFDTSKVHSIDIIMDNWDDFTANCKSEEYYACTVVIDNEAYKNVAIRGKGNTSLSQVNNDRYSYKIEFDHYNSANTYYGLDKLCLNNIIQDNTYMKDYLTYQMMNEMGVASPLCSYVYITVNGEDWGLYLAVEGVEESFLQRNYGKEYGELYKPDSMSMGGGRGNGKNFDFDEFSANGETDTENNTQIGNNNGFRQTPNGIANNNINLANQMPKENTQNGQIPRENQGEMFEDMPAKQMPNENMQEGWKPGNSQPEQNSEAMTPPDNFEMPEGMQNTMPDAVNGGMTNGSDDVLLKYIDDDSDSYSNIFDNAKTDISEADKTRLIQALKKLSNGEDLENTVDIEKVIRYFVVHNFVLNFDSYTGSMIHNYYLYENNGQMQMIPWDYNLAFGGFQSMGDATSLVNYPIDSPVSDGDIADRPMISWIFENEEYTELYHRYFAEFISDYFDSGSFSEMIDSINTMISPYVEKDPTKFCTYEEFKTGISTLKEFCLLRAESIAGQLDGTIGSTSDTQQSDTLIDAGELKINDMGSMGNMGLDIKSDKDIQSSQMPNSNEVETAPEIANSDGENFEEGNFDSKKQPSDKNSKSDNSSQNQAKNDNGISASFWILITVSLLVLIVGLVFAFNFKRRK